MSHASAWQTQRKYAATAARWSHERWRTESERRRTLRAERRPMVGDARRAVAQARAIDPQGVTSLVHRAERELATAKRRVPDPMWLFASKTALGIAAAGYIGLPLVPDRGWMWSAIAVTVAVVGAIVWAATHRPAKPDIEPTAEERDLLKRLQPEHWREHAEQRGLAGTITGRPTLTESGITVAVRLDGKWTPGKLADAEGNVRALLGCRTALRMEIQAGERGGWGTITLRTRLAADGARMDWTPDAVGIGLDTVTGKPVEIPLDNRLTVAGASGSGKSWSSRPHMARAHITGDLVFVDGKGEEATIWEQVCRTAVEPEEIRTTVAEVHAEMNRRKVDMKRRGLSVWDGEQLTLFVDEGRVILALKDKALTQQLIDISALGRSRGVVLKWATQYPVTSGDAPGIHAQIAANTDSRFALRVKNLTHAQVALDDDADYGPHLIPAVKDMRGHGYLGGHGPHLIRTWTMTDDMVKALPAKRWHGPVDTTTGQGPSLRLVKQAPADAPDSTEARVLAVVTAAEQPIRQKVLAEQTGLSKGTVSKVVKRLTDDGRIVRQADGGLTADEAA
ncbi:MarR family transcriptional regulator [Streptomyces sp. NPDC005571]|uniref:MarR family transcriptional regulator n=1 Tax=unclassified Streptomyces TaxID=2593676 RepID=UPI0033BEAB43